MKNEENKNLIEEVKKHFDIRAEETKRHFDVVAEELKSQFKVFGEQLSDVKTKVDSLEVKADSLVEDMDYVKSTLTENKDRFREIDDVSSNHEKRLAKLENSALAKV
jgi:hypothetical protein